MNSLKDLMIDDSVIMNESVLQFITESFDEYDSLDDDIVTEGMSKSQIKDKEKSLKEQVSDMKKEKDPIKKKKIIKRILIGAGILAAAVGATAIAMRAKKKADTVEVTNASTDKESSTPIKMEVSPTEAESIATQIVNSREVKELIKDESDEESRNHHDIHEERQEAIRSARITRSATAKDVAKDLQDNPRTGKGAGKYRDHEKALAMVKGLTKRLKKLASSKETDREVQIKLARIGAEYQMAKKLYNQDGNNHSLPAGSEEAYHNALEKVRKNLQDYKYPFKNASESWIYEAVDYSIFNLMI